MSHPLINQNMKKKIQKTDGIKIQKQIIGKFNVNSLEVKMNTTTSSPDTITSSYIGNQF
ncbi:hypothetical protein [Pedobacter sp. NJ-S-72]